MWETQYERHNTQNLSNKVLSKMHEITVVAMGFSKMFSLGNFMIFLRI